MMKNLLVLALVLGMATVATAGFSFDVAPTNDSAKLLGDYTGVDYYIVIAANGAITVAAGANAPDATGSVIDSALGAVSGIADGFDGPVWTIARYGSGASIVGGHLLTISGFEVPVTLKVYMVDENYAGTEMASVNIVPEPMTMALLGLGGLFLRRRK